MSHNHLHAKQNMIADFFPYADNTFSVWAGYFSSRPSLKGYVRDTSSYLQSTRALLWAADIRDADIEFLEKTMGTLQHHDAVTGTESQHVAFDYARRAALGHHLARKPVSDALQALTDVTTEWTDCPLTNVSMCDIMETNDNVAVAVTNQLAQERTVVVRTVVSADQGGSWKVTDSNGNDVTAQLVPLSSRDQSLRKINGGDMSRNVQWLVFRTHSLPALGFDTYFVQQTSSIGAPHTVPSKVSHPSPSQLRGLSSIDFSISNKLVELTFDGKTGFVKSGKNLLSGVAMPLSQEFMWWNASVGNGTGAESQASGAYIFRPNKTYAYTISDKASIAKIDGPVVQEVHQSFADWVTQVIRVTVDSVNPEFEWTVGPIPIAVRGFLLL